MINSIIFSKDRAIQLRLLLESIKINANNIFNINIIYIAETEELEQGYNKLISEQILPNINWIKQTEDFKQDVINLINKEYSYTCFFVDDDIIYKKIESENEITQHFSDENVFCFSGRLGKNITYCYSMNTNNKVVPLFDDGKYIKWEWKPHYYDFQYALSLDFHVFRTNDILKLIKKTSFFNPNSLEGNIQMFNTYPRDIMVSYTTSVMVNTPLNRVQDTCPNRCGEQFGITPQELNKKYLSGEVIDFDKIDFSNINSPHCELNLTFKIYE